MPIRGHCQLPTEQRHKLQPRLIYEGRAFQEQETEVPRPCLVFVNSKGASVPGSPQMYPFNTIDRQIDNICIRGLSRRYPTVHYEQQKHLLKKIQDTRNIVHRTMTPQSPSKQAPWDLTQFSQSPSAAPSYFSESHSLKSLPFKR